MTPKLSSRLSKLIPRLASDSEGEVLATVRAIRVSLQAEGLDLHDLATCVENGADPIPAVREPFRWPDPSPSPATEAETMRGTAEARAEEAARRQAERAAQRAETFAKDKAAKARCDGKGDRAPTWGQLLEQSNRVALIVQWIDWFLDMDITAAERECATDMRQAVKFDRLGMRPDGVRRFNGWLVRTFNHRRKTADARQEVVE